MSETGAMHIVIFFLLRASKCDFVCEWTGTVLNLRV